jgi:adenylate kinase family enzyme
MAASPPALDALIASDRILVIGPSGSGKTYLSRRLAGLLDRPVVHLDACFWRPGWISMPQAEWREAVEALVQPPRWIMDGTYESTLPTRLAASDAVILLERSRWGSLLGVIRRSLTHRNQPRPDAPPGQPIDRAFLRYIWQYPARTLPLIRRLLAEHGRDKAVVVLKGRGDIDRLLSQVRGRLQSSQGIVDSMHPKSGRFA